MSEVRCARCDQTAEGLPRAPLPGGPGDLVLAETCGSCWQLWREEQIKLINEKQLSPANSEHYDLLVQEMKRFLGLPT